MATATWAAPGTQSSNLAGTTMDSKSNGAQSGAITYDNSTAKDLQAFVSIGLGSLTPGVAGTITLVAYPTAGGGADVPDDTSVLGGGERYTIPLTTSTGAKMCVIPIRLYPCSMRLYVVNNSGVPLAASGNSLKVQPFDESIV